MKAVLALLATEKVQDFVRNLAGQLHEEEGFMLFSSYLPTHVSLKQGFEYEDEARLARYATDLSTRIRPVQIELDSFYLWDTGDYGVLGLNVVETGVLRGLHNRLNRELREVVRDPSAPYDGDHYRFHVTIEIGQNGPSMVVLRDFYQLLPEKKVNLRFISSEMALIVNRNEEMEPNAFEIVQVYALSGGRR